MGKNVINVTLLISSYLYDNFRGKTIERMKKLSLLIKKKTFTKIEIELNQINFIIFVSLKPSCTISKIFSEKIGHGKFVRMCI